MPRVNYDQIADLYDHPLRAHAPDQQLAAFLAGRPNRGRAGPRILDVGCGTGTQLAANQAPHPGLFSAGLDPSRGMLTVARRRAPGVSWIQGEGGRLPFRSNSFEYVSNQFSYHHMPDKALFFREVFRVLAPGGRFMLLNIDPWSMERWIIYRFFPAARARDEVDFFPAVAVAELIEAAGFEDVRVDQKQSLLTEDLHRYREQARRRYYASQLMAISDGDYRRGLASIDAELAAGGEQVAVPSEFCLLTVLADKPAGARQR